ncbi:hypothetical protein HPB47_022110 [Ixodes persulcatus]|uniref:Uncharacterized protein n=1 Tax=Ixodes persulcatus TaxID=34615 RepID=A0AC60QBF8_IXOPE|nr:hypothetical protein HPB47_022110 [Ixodes persulcatus]
MNPLFVFPLVMAYLYFVKVAGPRWMKDKEPFQIINLIRFYNLAMVLLNARFLYIVLIYTYLPGGEYSLWCQGITGRMTDQLAALYESASWYVAVRYADFLDTVFFVLRKKFTHITHLHVIHHTVVAVNAWFWVLFAPEGQPALGLAMNAFVHVVMYAYYFLATLGPNVRQYLWWKKYLTTMQIVQFVIFIGHMSIPLFVDCGFPRHLIHETGPTNMLGNDTTGLTLTMSPVKFFSELQQLGDPQTRNYTLVMNPLFVFPLVMAYLYFVKVAGPWWMKDKEPF